MVRKKSKKKVLPLLVIISAIIFTGLIGAIFLFNIKQVSAVDYYTSGTPFTAFWNTSKISTGSSNSTTIWLPLVSTGEYNFTVYWGDGNVDTITAWDDATTNHTYATAGTYLIKINGTLKGFQFNNLRDKNKIGNITHWGDLQPINTSVFYQSTYVNFTGTDAINLTGTTSLASMFRFTSAFRGNLSNWDTSEVTSLNSIFYQGLYFNGDISGWDTGKVTSLAFTFTDTPYFNSNISNWNTSSVTSMDSTFREADIFNQPISNWNTSKVTNLDSTFENASLFNQNLNWDTNLVTNLNDTFRYAISFNGNISSWNTKNVFSMTRTFDGATSFDGNLSSWNVTKLINASKMFNGIKLSKENYDSLLLGWSSQALKNNTVFDGGNSKYTSAGLVGRDKLINTYNWTITDGGMYIGDIVINFSTFLKPITGIGVNTHGGFLSDGTMLDMNSNWITDDTQFADYEWHRQQFQNSGMNYIRADMYLKFYSTSEGVISESVRNGNYFWNISTARDLVKWANETGKIVLWNGLGTPMWLVNDTTGLCNLNSRQSNSTCPPTDYTKYGQAHIDFLDAVDCDLYPNNCELELGNEIELATFFLDNLTRANTAYFNATITTYYNNMYNATLTAIRNDATYSGMRVGGPALNSEMSLYSQVIMDSWLGNFSTDPNFEPYFISTHAYFADSQDFEYLTDMMLDRVTASCDRNGVYCSPIYFDEFNYNNNTILNSTAYDDKFSYELALAYYTMFKYENLTIVPISYQWSENVPFTSTGSRYPDYPSRWVMVTDPNLKQSWESSHTVLYNTTKNIAHVCPVGSSVTVTESFESNLKIVACNKSNFYGMFIINKGSAFNVTANLTNNTNSKMFPYTSIMNYETGASIPVSTSGIAQLGVIGEYEVLYLYSGLEEGAVLTNQFKFNEATGTKVYDLLQNVTYGTISGATWINDSILITLSAVQYTIDLVTGLLTLDTDYLYEYLFVDYDYNKVFGFHVSILGVIAGFLMIIVLGVGIIYVVKYFKNIKELE